MPESLEIRQIVTGDETVVRAFDVVSKSVKATGDAAKFTQGPFQRQLKLMQEMRRAQAGGNVAAQRDIGLAQTRNQRQITGAQGKSFGEKALQALKSSRVGAGGLMPLVGQLAELAEAGGPIGVLAAGLVAAGAAAKALADSAAAASQQFQALQFAGGGTASQTGRLSALAGVAGLSPDQAGALAQNFNQRITTDPTAMAFAGQAGVTNAPGAFGSTNDTRELMQMVEYLRSIRDSDEQIRAARATGTEALLPLTKLSQATINRTLALGDQQAALADGSGSQEYVAAQKNLALAFQNFTMVIGVPLMNALTPLLNGLTGLTQIIEKLYGLDPDRAVKENTAATKANTAALMPGQIGHGARADGALPPGLDSGFAMAKMQAQGQAYKLGAYGG